MRSLSLTFSKLTNAFSSIARNLNGGQLPNGPTPGYTTERVHVNPASILKKYFGSYFVLWKIGAHRWIELVELWLNTSLDKLGTNFTNCSLRDLVENVDLGGYE